MMKRRQVKILTGAAKTLVGIAIVGLGLTARPGLAQEANVIELLGWASKLLKEQRKGEAAEFVGGVAERMRAAWRQQRERGRDAERNLHERVERLERRLEKLANIVERLVDELEDKDQR